MLSVNTADRLAVMQTTGARPHMLPAQPQSKPALQQPTRQAPSTVVSSLQQHPQSASPALPPRHHATPRSAAPNHQPCSKVCQAPCGQELPVPALQPLLPAGRLRAHQVQTPSLPTQHCMPCSPLSTSSTQACHSGHCSSTKCSAADKPNTQRPLHQLKRDSAQPAAKTQRVHVAAMSHPIGSVSMSLTSSCFRMSQHTSRQFAALSQQYVATPSRIRRHCAHTKHHQRRCQVACRAAAESQSTGRDLWDYSGTAVQTLQLDTFRLFHGVSFNHFNRRTYVVVVYHPDSPASRACELEIERLARGLAHVPTIKITKLSAADPAARQFVQQVMDVKEYPTVFLYPEASRGCMRYKGNSLTAEALLESINRCLNITRPNQSPLELKDVSLTAVVTSSPADISTPATNSADISKLESTATATVQAESPSATSQDTVQRSLTASQAVPAVPTDSAASVHKAPQGYWTMDKYVFWGAIVGLSVLSVVWERWLAPWLDRRAIEQRQAERAKGVKFDPEQNVEDMAYLLLEGKGPSPEEFRKSLAAAVEQSSAGGPPTDLRDPDQQQSTRQ